MGKGVTGDLIINTGDPTIGQSSDSHIPAQTVRELINIAQSKYEAVDELIKDG